MNATQYELAVPPIPRDQIEAARVEHTRFRRRMLYGRWASDLQTRMTRNLGAVRSEAIGEPDMSANPFEAVCAAASALYDRIPRIHQPDAASQEAMVSWTNAAMLYPLMARVQRDVLGMREEFLRVSVHLVNGAPRVTYSPAYADMVCPRPDPRDPSRPIAIEEFVLRENPQSGQPLWTLDCWSIDGVPTHRVTDVDGVDLSEHYGLPTGGLRGDDYPAIRRDGVAILPYATYHAAITGCLLDPWYRQELVQGSLNVAVLWTFLVHCVRAASWPQRWISGGFVSGAGVEGNIRRVVADPATILEILQDPGFEGQVSAGQWGSASDPKAVAEAVGLYEQRFTGYVELGSELWRRNADPRSGIALTLDRTGRIEAQRRYSPVFAPVDAEVLSITAVLVNRALAVPLVAEDGWVVEHVALPAPMDQRKADREEWLTMLSQGLVTKAEARAAILGETEAEAELGIPTTPETPLVGIAVAVAGIVAQVAAGTLPRDAGIALVARSYGITVEEATPLMGSAGAGFESKGAPNG